ncbi:triose-phosphate transporter family-domain-containing protein [Neohortaea acidophila]|uniref:Triose-phosphate transporter family-domain-containing protein n=1 Tax=Neohortaea acidophila TaxID=245834 RepID=A0A6A6Q701_9PEZI|nr:triose-phosphate transporter family-domain-containing protein [Neohortaea acidophila]KAF2487413.1 triose-phosphate transporter family-domain-containing protein [Neohortaea acidophila]
MPATRRKNGHAIDQLFDGSRHAGREYLSGGSDDSEGKALPDLEMDVIRSDDESMVDDEETGLTPTQRKQRTRRKTMNSRLDGQVSGAVSMRSVPGSNGTTDEKLVTTTLLKNVLLNAVLIGLWYTFSISISVYNKWMFSGENLDFPYPLFTTSLHMLVQFALAASVLYFLPHYRPGNSPVIRPHEASYSRLSNNDIDGDPQEDLSNGHTQKPNALQQDQEQQQQPLMTKFFYLTRIGPCGTATALDIGLGNFSLRFISLTFFTMCKSSVLGFVLLFAFLFHLERPTWKLILIIALMTIGVIMMVAGETAFNALGFVLVMLASFCSGFRWSLTQILLLRNRATSNPFSSIFFLTPVMFLALFALALPIEGPSNVIQGVKDLAASEGGFQSFLLLLFPGILAFLMVSAEFALLKRTSVVTLSVCGIFKEVLTISAAGAIFGDELSPINVSGLVVTILSIVAYNYLKYTKMRQEAVQEAQEIFGDERQGSLERSGKATAVVGGPGAAGDAGGVERRRGSSMSLMQDTLNLQTDMSPGDIGQGSTQANGALSHSPVNAKRPEHLK